MVGMSKLMQCQSKAEWDDYVLENGGHPLQLWGWGDLKAAHGWSACRLFYYNDDKELTGAIQVLIRKLPWPLRSLAYVPRGPIVDIKDRDDLLAELVAYIKSNFHSVAITVEPDEEKYRLKTDWQYSKNYILPARTILLDLAKNEAELMTDMAKKTRQYIRKSATEGLKIKKVNNREELAKCLAIYSQTAKRAGFELHEESYYYDAFDKIGDYNLIYAAYSDSQPVAFLWLTISAGTAYELYGGMNGIGQQLRANYMLKWYAIRKCREWGLRRYDFGGILDGGIATFKKGWAKEETKLAGTFDRPLSIFYSFWTKGLPTAKKILRKLKSKSKE